MLVPRPVEILVGPENPKHLEAIRAGLAPRLDYHLVAAQCRGHIRACHASPAAWQGPKILRLVRAMSANLRMAVQIVKSVPAGSVIYSTGETWGLPVAIVSTLMGRRHIHVMYVHRVYSRLWLQLIRLLRSFLHVDGWICITQYQADLLRHALGSAGAPVTVVSQGVDTAFFDSARAGPLDRSPYILSVGAEMRNYPLLFEAVQGLDVQVMVKASSTWMAGMRQQVRSIPPNVTLLTEQLSYPDLRNLYAGAALVVVPLYDTPQAAGITTILEAMAMHKCIVATHSHGLPDGLVEGSTGLITEATCAALGRSIHDLISRTDLAHQLAANAFCFVRQEASLEVHAAKVESFMQVVLQNARVQKQV